MFPVSKPRHRVVCIDRMEFDANGDIKPDFVIHLSLDEANALRCQNVTSKCGFLMLDGTELYRFGASLKDLGRHYCAVSKMDPMFIQSIM